jgi:nickel-dependent lactate racemase
MEASSPGAVLDRLHREFVLGGHKAAAIAAIVQRASVSMVSSMSDEQVRRIWMAPYPDLQAALQESMEKLGESSQILVLPQAGSTIPEVV